MINAEPVRLVARRTWARRWRDLTVVAVIVAVTVGFVLALVLGAWRATTAQARLRAASSASDVQITADPAEGRAVLRSAEQVEGVAAAGLLWQPFATPAASELFPSYNLTVIAPDASSSSRGVDAPVPLRGRLPDQDAVDEAAVSEALATRLGVEVGDQIEVATMSPDWVAAIDSADPGPPDGPVVPVRVVGIARTPTDFSRVPDVLHLTAAFVERYRDEVGMRALVDLRLDGNLAERVAAGEPGPLVQLPGDEVQPSPFAASEAVDDGLRTIAAGFGIVALVAAVAGSIVVGLSCARLGRDLLTDRVTFRALGWTKAQLSGLVTLCVGPWVLVGVGLGTAVGVAASRWASIGLARAVDPSAGDVAVSGVRVTVVVVGATVTAAALVVLSSIGATVERAAVPGRRIHRPLLRAPLALAIGTRRALFGSRDGGGRTSRAAAAAGVVGVALAVASLVIGGSIQRLLDDPFLSGGASAEERLVDAGDDADAYREVLAALEGDERVADVAGAAVVQAIDVHDGGDANAIVLDRRRGGVPEAAILHGRLPAQPDEVVLGPATAETLDAGVGDAVELSAPGATESFRVVGLMLFPEGDFTHDRGIGLTTEGAARLVAEPYPEPAFYQVIFRWARGVDPVKADESLAAGGLEVFTSQNGLVPAVVSNLGEVRSLPRLVTAVVVVLAMLTLVHALLEGGRRRTNETLALQAIGMRRSTVHSILLVHGGVLAALAIALGIPLGIAAGRLIWTTIAQRANVLDRPAVPWTGIVLLALSLIIGTLAIATPSSRHWVSGRLDREPGATLPGR